MWDNGNVSTRYVEMVPFDYFLRPIWTVVEKASRVFFLIADTCARGVGYLKNVFGSFDGGLRVYVYIVVNGEVRKVRG